MPKKKLPKKFKWVVEFEVDQTWVEDGFELTDAMARSMIQEKLGYAFPFETDARVVKAPDKKEIHKVQGYKV